MPGPLPFRLRRTRPTFLEGLVVGAVLAVLVLQLFGCGSVERIDDKRERQDEAMRLTWNVAYARKEPPPLVVWVRDEQLSCIDPVSGDKGFPVLLADVGLTCRGGVTGVVVFLADYPVPFSETTWAHELRHAADALDFVIDPKHEGAAWQVGGAVDSANRLLAVAGL